MPYDSVELERFGSKWLLKCGHAVAPEVLGGRDELRRWMRQFRLDVTAMSKIRVLVAEQGIAYAVWRMSDEDVLGRVADLLGTGLWHVEPAASPVAERPGSAGVSKAERAAAAGQPPPARPSGRSVGRATRLEPEAVEPDTFGWRADQAAQAATLRAAAATGVPFCEECARPGPAAAAGRPADLQPLGDR